ncbi:MAG: lipoyl(octanoyl) transferase LipB [Bryobacteraceae bacterium]
MPEGSNPGFEVRDLGRMRYGDALAIQQDLVEQRKRGLIPDQLLFIEHPHVITQGRNGHAENLLASEEALRSAGIEFFPTNRGGDITYHGPGQIVGYPIVDLREWKRDVVAYVRGIEQVMIDALAEFGLVAGRVPGCTGVWIDGKKVAAIGVHISRWVTSHGFALNHTTDLRYFQYIVPCGLTKPVTSMQELGSGASREQVLAALSASFARQFHGQPGFQQPNYDQPSRDHEGAGFSYTETYS